MSPKPATPELERFVRQTLGCGCPAEVFAQVDEAPSEHSLAAGAERRLAIGGRLLVYLLEAEDEAAAAAKLRLWVAAGLAERDAAGMNRLRLALVLRNPTPEAAETLERSFQAIAAEADDRLHLHVLDTASAAALRQTPAASTAAPGSAAGVLPHGTT